MTTDELIDLGHKAGTLFITQFGVASVTVEWLENFAALVAAAEREACAEICDRIARRYGDGPEVEHWAQGFKKGASVSAAKIRARGKK